MLLFLQLIIPHDFMIIVLLYSIKGAKYSWLVHAGVIVSLCHLAFSQLGSIFKSSNSFYTSHITACRSPPSSMSPTSFAIFEKTNFPQGVSAIFVKTNFPQGISSPTGIRTQDARFKV